MWQSDIIWNDHRVCVALTSHCGTALTWWEKRSWTASWVRCSQQECRGCAVHTPASENPALRTHSESCLCVFYSLAFSSILMTLNPLSVLQTPACPAFRPVQLYGADIRAGGHPDALQTAAEPQRRGTRAVWPHPPVCESDQVMLVLKFLLKMVWVNRASFSWCRSLSENTELVRLNLCGCAGFSADSLTEMLRSCTK